MILFGLVALPIMQPSYVALMTETIQVSSQNPFTTFYLMKPNMEVILAGVCGKRVIGKNTVLPFTSQIGLGSSEAQQGNPADVLQPLLILSLGMETIRMVEEGFYEAIAAESAEYRGEKQVEPFCVAWPVLATAN